MKKYRNNFESKTKIETFYYLNIVASYPIEIDNKRHSLKVNFDKQKLARSSQLRIKLIHSISRKLKRVSASVTEKKTRRRKIAASQFDKDNTCILWCDES